MSRRRGTILLGVLVVVTVAAFAGTSIVFTAGVERASSDVAMRRDQLRSMAWSGVQAVMAELASQREELLAGAWPDLTREWTLFEEPSGRRGVVRLLPVSAGDEPAVPESAKLDINHATAAMLASLEAIGPDLAEAIVGERARAPYSSVEELLRVPGVTPALLYGGAIDGAGGNGPALADAFGRTPESPRLLDLLTVFSFEPNVQAGVAGEAHRGRLRLNFNVQWSDRLRRAIAREFDENVAVLVEGIFRQGHNFRSDADIVRVMQAYSVPPSDWGGGLDVISTTDNEYRPGRIDLLRAPAEVLACVPGISSDQAAQIVALRDSIEGDARLTPAWLVAEGVLASSEFLAAVDWLCVRSMQWRVRIEVGIVLEERARPEVGIGGVLPGFFGEERLTERMVVDAVIDVASRRPRVAYLRDLTLLEPARLLASEVDELREELGLEGDLSGSLALLEGDGVSPTEPIGAGEPDEVRTMASRSRSGVGSGRAGQAGRMAGRMRSDQSEPGIETEEEEEGLVMHDRRIGRWTGGGTG